MEGEVASQADVLELAWTHCGGSVLIFCKYMFTGTPGMSPLPDTWGRDSWEPEHSLKTYFIHQLDVGAWLCTGCPLCLSECDNASRGIISPHYPCPQLKSPLESEELGLDCGGVGTRDVRASRGNMEPGAAGSPCSLALAPSASLTECR